MNRGSTRMASQSETPTLELRFGTSTMTKSCANSAVILITRLRWLFPLMDAMRFQRAMIRQYVFGIWLMGENSSAIRERPCVLVLFSLQMASGACLQKVRLYVRLTLSVGKNWPL